MPLFHYLNFNSCLFSLTFNTALFHAIMVPQCTLHWLHIHPFTHRLVVAAMQGTDSPIGSNFG